MMRRIWLCLPPIAFALVDYLITMAGQSSAYWEGEFDDVNEANPLVPWLMTIHPVAFHGLTIVWVVGITAAIFLTPRLLARLLSAAVTFSHAFCIGTWLYPRPYGFFYALGVCVLGSIAMVLALDQDQAQG